MVHGASEGCNLATINGGGGGGGSKAHFLWRIRFELWAPQVPLIEKETFAEVLGPRRLTA